MEEHQKNAISKHFNKIIYLVKKLDARLEELEGLLKTGQTMEKKKVPVYENKPTLLEFK
jgi:hypothetical protein